MCAEVNSRSALYQPLTEAELVRVVAAGLHTRPVSQKLLTGGLFNTTYLVNTAHCGKVVLRMGPVNRHLLMPFEQHLMESEAQVYDLLAQRGVAASEILAVDLSKTVVDRDFMFVRYRMRPRRRGSGARLPGDRRSRRPDARNLRRPLRPRCRRKPRPRSRPLERRPLRGSAGFADALENRHHRFSLLRQRVFHSRRYLIVLSADHEIVMDELLQRGGKHRVRNVQHFLANAAVSQGALFIQHADDPGFPFSAEQLQPIFQGTSNVRLQFLLIHSRHLRIFWLHSITNAFENILAMKFKSSS